MCIDWGINDCIKIEFRYYSFLKGIFLLRLLGFIIFMLIDVIIFFFFKFCFEFEVYFWIVYFEFGFINDINIIVLIKGGVFIGLYVINWY